MSPIIVRPDQDCRIEGLVTGVIRYCGYANLCRLLQTRSENGHNSQNRPTPIPSNSVLGLDDTEGQQPICHESLHPCRRTGVTGNLPLVEKLRLKPRLNRDQIAPGANPHNRSPLKVPRRRRPIDDALQQTNLIHVHTDWELHSLNIVGDKSVALTGEPLSGVAFTVLGVVLRKQVEQQSVHDCPIGNMTGPLFAHVAKPILL
jgi:hypothetical protein